jgi:hypothetical protein
MMLGALLALVAVVSAGEAPAQAPSPNELLAAYIKRGGYCSGLPNDGSSLIKTMYQRSLETCVMECNMNAFCVMFDYQVTDNTDTRCRIFKATCAIVQASSNTVTYDKRPLNPRTRLAGGLYPYEGRAEYQKDDGTWGTICDSGYDLAYWPSVFCREAGYQRAAAGWYCTGTLVAPQMPLALIDIGCNVNYLFTRHCPQEGAGCGH